MKSNLRDTLSKLSYLLLVPVSADLDSPDSPPSSDPEARASESLLSRLQITNS